MSLTRSIVILLAAALLFGIATKASAQEQRDRVLRSSIQPLLKKYCLDCHNPDDAEADLNLAEFRTSQAILEGRTRWLKVLRNLQTKKMPPPEMDQPSDAERQRIVSWLDDLLNNIDCQNLHNPGRPTIRRLNRTEYRNTIRDLVGVDYEPAADFPGDDVGYGFDNIGDVLSLPPLLMEKYLTAAEEISQKAIATEGVSMPLVRKIFGADLQAGKSQVMQQRARGLFANGAMHTQIKLPVPGEYEFRTTAYGDQAGPQKVQMNLLIDGKTRQKFTVAAVRAKPRGYVAKIRLKAGQRKIALAFTNDYYNPKAKNPQQRDRNLVVQHLEVRGPLDYRPPNLPASHRAIVISTPGAGVTRRDASGRVLRRLASRAYRRPATTAEVDRLLRFTDLAEQKGDNFEAGIQLALQAILVSPHFLFKVEMPSDKIDQHGNYGLSDYELASSMSYFLWSSMPDQQLFADAHSGRLRQDDSLERHAIRMVNSPRSRTLIVNFAEQWLQLRNLETLRPDSRLFPSFTAQLAEAMRMETLLFFNEVLRKDGGLLDLLRADYTFLNEALAKHYGVSGISGSDFQKVSLNGTNRGGLLTHASVLTITSNPTRTSPVKRGKWILENLLNAPPPPPAPDVMELDDQEQLTGTLRQRMEQHRSDPNCASCHQQMDPLGFALENFDAIGRWRTRDGEGAIDASGEFFGVRFLGPRQMQAALLKTKRDDFVRALTEKMLTYALGRGLEYYDKCAVDKIIKALEKDDYRFSTLIVEIVKSEPFQRRKK